jgi:SAM-dependent methyltransferase
MVIHHSAAEGFAAGADTYAKGRPDYPPEIDAWLREDLGLGPGRAALELGAGTGKFTRRLCATGATVVAVEPVAAMLEQLRAACPEADARQGSAERTGAGPSCADAVVCAQAFHWFANDAAMAEIRRVLAPGGALGLVWNVRDERVPWVEELTRIMDPYEGDAPRFRTMAWRRCFPAEGFGPLEERRFPHAHVGSIEDVIVARVLSVSFIAALPPPARDAVRAEVRALVTRTPELAGRSEVAFPYETRVLWCRKL